MRDTSPKITEKVLEMIRQKTPEERMMMGFSMYETSRQLIINAILEKNPGISLKDLRCEFFLKFYGADFKPGEREKILNHLRQIEDGDEKFWR